jgi:hypothetical protein
MNAQAVPQSRSLAPQARASHGALAAELAGVLTDAVAGRLAHEALEGTLAREARAVLLRHGLGGAQIVVERADTRFHVHVRLPGATAQVLSVRVTLDG